MSWETVTSPKGERAWTAGQLRAALADLPDDAPGDRPRRRRERPRGRRRPDHHERRVGDGYGMERDPVFALERHWHTKDQLLIRPQRPRCT
ncbi:DUF6225 family protein [Nonomuraea angiospora]|uniref:DUF6225 family protein n=1 Tax=Nonomuraea angiospora TaxID=46172 RepID=UPI0033DC7D54